MSDPILLRTPLRAWHQSRGGRLVEFGGWEMPVQYSTIVEEHKAVRERAGLFDICHMGRLAFEGPDALAWLDFATTNRIGDLELGQVRYSLMVNDDGGVLDDILVYRLPEDGYAVVCNASNRVKVIERFRGCLGAFDARLIDRTRETAMLAIQGPAALAILQRHCDVSLDDVGYYRSVGANVLGHPALISRTGYTGEDGFEFIVDVAVAEPAANALIDSGRVFGLLPCGLGARDTLRLEAAMPLYGHEMDESVNPFETGLGWAVKLDKGAFAGGDSLERAKASRTRTRIGLKLEGKRIARQGCPVLVGDRRVGEVTSGTYSPTLDVGIAMALVEASSPGVGTTFGVDIRGRLERAERVNLPFYRRYSPNPRP